MRCRGLARSDYMYIKHESLIAKQLLILNYTVLHFIVLSHMI